MSNREIKIAVRETLIELGLLPKTITRQQVIKLYGRNVWEKAVKSIPLFTNGKSQYVNRTQFNAWVDANLFNEKDRI